MDRSILRYGLGACTLAQALVLASAVLADTITLKASLKAADEVPPNPSTATGTLQGTYDTATKQLTYTVNYSGLSGDAVGAHFHGPADPGTNAGIVVPAQAPITSPIKGTATLTDAQAAELLAGKWYFNVHTAANKGGEIRGWVSK
jgi:CHRD domain